LPNKNKPANELGVWSYLNVQQHYVGYVGGFITLTNELSGRDIMTLIEVTSKIRLYLLYEVFSRLHHFVTVLLSRYCDAFLIISGNRWLPCAMRPSLTLTIIILYLPILMTE
jgi:hypothetical protein